ncbi:tail fiber domain-containing protein [Chryseobacterium sp. BLS98]|uniref:tail fiber domain-containing protein n=1 Tax=Chryseobacterium sp. BLS98 TaxID=885586 RepID=UPI00069FFEBD|nr:tail fiber domain-containing protein [Chryseobacterium sp. BLS98]
MKKMITLLGIVSCGIIFAQTGNVGINTANPNPNAVLDVVSANRGLLPPRIALTSTSSPSPLSAHVAGMIVYNTALVADVQPALYYNDGTQWVLSKGSATGGATTNVLSTSGNTITSTVNGVASTAAAVNTNNISLSGTNLTSTVNGISSPSLNLAPAIAAATTHTLSMSGNTLTSNVNGIAPTASVITSNTLTKPTTNTLRSSVNGVTASPDVTLISSVGNTLSGTLLSTSVNGITGPTVDLSSTMKNIYNSDGTLTSGRTMNMAGNVLTMANGGTTSVFNHTFGQAQITNTGTSRGTFTARAGGSILDIYVDNGNAAQIVTSGTTTQLIVGTTTATPLGLFTGGLVKMTVTPSGSVGIGTASPTSLLSVNGSADKPGGGSWGTFSDRRVKKDIAEFKDGLNVITKLNPVTYKYNEKSGYKDLDTEYVGFIAQDVEKAAPYMVKIIDDTKKSGLKDKRELDESALTKILVNAVKEQQQEIALLRKEIEVLKNRK